MVSSKTTACYLVIVGCLSGLFLAKGVISNQELKDGDCPNHIQALTAFPHLHPTETDDRNCSEQDLDVCIAKDCSRTDQTDLAVCITKDCALTAAMLISAMDTSVDPCDNFYDFACANFIQNNPVPDNQERKSSYETFNQHFDLQLKNLVEGMGPLNSPDVIFRAQELYHVCINTTYQRDKEAEAFANFTRITLDWPLAWGSAWQPRMRHLGEALAAYESGGFTNAWVTIQIYLHHEDQIYEVRMDTVKEAVDHSALNKEQLQVLKELLHLLGNDDEDAIEDDMRDMKQFVLNQAAFHSGDNSELRFSDENFDNASDALRPYLARSWAVNLETATVSFRMLEELTEYKIDWLGIVNGKTRQNSVTFTEDDNITISNPLRFRRHFARLQQTPLRTLLNVMGWRELVNLGLLAEYTNPEIRTSLQKLAMEEEDQSAERVDLQEPPTWKKCLNKVTLVFPLAITRLFLDKYIDRSEKGSADEMIRWIQNAYIKILRDSEWLDKVTKKSAVRKAAKIKRYVGYPDFIFDDAQLDTYYENFLPTIRSTLFENGVELWTKVIFPFVMKQLLGQKRQDFEEWKADPLTKNAYYQHDDNTIWFPSGILQLPFFHDKRLAALNFGMIGSVIGHEIGHAFDDSGSTFDEKGQVKDWWTSQTKTTFKRKSTCFVSQYNDFCPEFLQGEEDKVCVNGEWTLGENLADYTGLNAAYVAYKMWVKKHGVEKRLPGLQKFNPEQLLFIGHAYLWCENIAVDKWESRYKYDNHAPGRYRILGSLSNNVFFREVFQCPPGPMNRANESCTMW